MYKTITGTPDEVFTELNVLEDKYKTITFSYALKENDNLYSMVVEVKDKRYGT